MLNFGKFDHKKGKYILAGGTSCIKSDGSLNEGNEAKIFDITNKHYVTFVNKNSGFNCGNFSHNNEYVALGTADGYMKIYNIELP